ncbi:helix-turn-helix domain-containing protein [Bacteroidota bacterium]
MKFDISKYKNIDKSTIELFNEKEKFSLLYLENNSDTSNYTKHTLDGNYIQLYFSLQGKVKIAFNMEHCAIYLSPEDSGLIYFKDDAMNVLFELPPNSKTLGLLISVSFFHSLFASEGDYFFNFENMKGGRPVIEEKIISPTLKIVLNQIVAKKLHGALQSLYIKGKIYELLSLYFNISEETESDHCPFMANEETVAQIKKAKDIIIENMSHPPSLEELSKAVGLNIKKLKMGFKEFYGAPVFTFLLNYKLEHSKKLLEENKLNVSEVALQIGYSNSSHFIAAFKKKFGITPKQFTKQDNN